MSKWTMLDSQSHSLYSWKPMNNFSFARFAMTVPITWSELSQVIRTQPIAFVESDGRFQLVALLSVLKDNNLFVDNQGQWLGGYVPQFYRLYPFRVMNLLDNQAKDSSEAAIAFDLESDCISEVEKPGFEPMFNDQSEPTRALKEQLKLLTNYHTQSMQTQKLVNILCEFDLFEPWTINIQSSDNGELTSMQGIYKINEDKLQSLDAQQAQVLISTNAVLLSSAHLLSQHRLGDFQAYIARKSYDTNMPKAELDLEEFFAQDNDGFKF